MTTTYLLRPDHFTWLLEMAEEHNLGFTNKTLKETVDHELTFRRRAIEAKVSALSAQRAMEHAHWKRIRNCRLPDRTAREVQSIAARHRVPFVDTLHVIVADAVARISRDHDLEVSIFEAPRSINCTSTLIRDLAAQKQSRQAAPSAAGASASASASAARQHAARHAGRAQSERQPVRQGARPASARPSARPAAKQPAKQGARPPPKPSARPRKNR